SWTVRGAACVLVKLLLLVVARNTA
ncbi:hypothetical protein A2U01_0094550, partial [Trifolium medium]|nr:hypothetical protein [Trifolium medium]